jgi:probable HAF family extracellular repeat protein
MAAGGNDLGTLGGRNSTVAAVNNAGQVVGAADTSDGIGHAFLWQQGKMIDLDPLGKGESRARAMNKAGQVVVAVRNESGARGVARAPRDSLNGQGEALLWQQGRMTHLGAGWGDAYAINNSGLVVGASYVATGDGGAVLWHHGVVTRLSPAVPADWRRWALAEARLINDLGQIVAYGGRHAFLLTPLGGTLPRSGAASVPSVVALCGLGVASVGVALRLYRRYAP